MKVILKALVLAVLLESVFPGIGINQETAEAHAAEEEMVTEDFTPKRGNNAPSGSEESTAHATEFTVSTAAIGQKADNWYCMHTEGGKRPPIPAEMAYITEHNGYFLGKDEKVIYLTFDAGYENGNIEKILDTLKEEQVPGAFFILENLVKQNTELVKRMEEEGHTVCNHTAKHRDMTLLDSVDEFRAELEKMENCYNEITGNSLAKYYRPPEGKLSEQNLAWADELGYRTILWSFAYADWDNNSQMSPEKAIDKIISGTHNGEVILLHPTSATNAEILPVLIRKWKEMGYRFGTLDELTGAGK